MSLSNERTCSVVSFRVMDDIYILSDSEGRVATFDESAVDVVDFLHAVYQRLSKYELWLRYDKYLPRVHRTTPEFASKGIKPLIADTCVEVHKLGDIYAILLSSPAAVDWHELGECPDLLAIAHEEIKNRSKKEGNEDGI